MSDPDTPEPPAEKPKYNPAIAFTEPKTTPEQRQASIDLIAEGESTAAREAAKLGVTGQYISTLLKKAGVTAGCRKREREEAARQAEIAARAKVAASFAERRATAAEQHKLNSLAVFNLAFQHEAVKLASWREAQKKAAATAPGGALAGPATAKDMNITVRTIGILDDKIRRLLQIDDEQAPEEDMPALDISYMGDEEIAAIRRGALSEDDIPPPRASETTANPEIDDVVEEGA